MKTQSSDVIPMNTGVQLRDDKPISEPMALFVAKELLPMMSGFWHKSAAQLNNNFTGNGLAYGLMLKGISVGLIRSVVVAQAESSREFAPTPQELKQLCLSVMNQAMPQETYRKEASIRALEMQAQAKALRGEISDAEIPGFTRVLQARYERDGFVVSGRWV
nr:hypothetical protein [uncultured Tolumonas sp.]